MNIKLILYEEWEELEVDGVVEFEGHSINHWMFIEFIKHHFNVEIEVISGDEEKLKERYGY